jgi:hypothetical protein
VTVYRFVTRDTIEEKIVELQNAKRELVAQILDGTDGALRLSNDELMALLACRGDSPGAGPSDRRGSGSAPARAGHK